MPRRTQSDVRSSRRYRYAALVAFLVVLSLSLGGQWYLAAHEATQARLELADVEQSLVECIGADPGLLDELRSGILGVLPGFLSGE